MCIHVCERERHIHKVRDSIADLLTRWDGGQVTKALAMCDIPCTRGGALMMVYCLGILEIIVTCNMIGKKTT